MELELLRQRFFTKIQATTSGCIVWTGARRPVGYGLLKVDGVMVGATHVSWLLKYGVWPTLKVLHRCDNPPCVNPDHLFEGTDADNAADRNTKGRQRSLRGFDAANAKLTDLEVHEIVALTNTRRSNKEIGELFGVSESYVSLLRHGRTRTKQTHKSLKPYACTTFVVGGEQLSIPEIAARAGVTDAAVRARVARGLTGEALLGGAHKTQRKQYLRKV